MIIRSVRNISWFLRTDKTLSTTLYFFFTLFSRRWRSHNKVCGRSESKFFITTENRYQRTLRVIYLYVQRRLSKTKVQLRSELEHILELQLQFAYKIWFVTLFVLRLRVYAWTSASHASFISSSYAPLKFDLQTPTTCSFTARDALPADESSTIFVLPPYLGSAAFLDSG